VNNGAQRRVGRQFVSVSLSLARVIAADWGRCASSLLADPPKAAAETIYRKRDPDRAGWAVKDYLATLGAKLGVPLN
jgi:hypothetical protein